MKKLLILTLTLVLGFTNTFAAELSENDKNLKLHIEKTLDQKFQNIVTRISKKYDANLQKYSLKEQKKFNEKVIKILDRYIAEILLKYPQDTALPTKANNSYLTLELFKLNLMEKSFEENTQKDNSKKESTTNTSSSNLVEALTTADISTKIPTNL